MAQLWLDIAGLSASRRYITFRAAGIAPLPALYHADHVSVGFCDLVAGDRVQDRLHVPFLKHILPDRPWNVVPLEHPRQLVPYRGPTMARIYAVPDGPLSERLTHERHLRQRLDALEAVGWERLVPLAQHMAEKRLERARGDAGDQYDIWAWSCCARPSAAC
jgi:hypothetical protein